MAALATCDPDKGCSPVQVLGERVNEHDRRLDRMETAIESLHSRITEEIKAKLGEAKQYAQDNKVWILLLINIVLMIIFKVWK